MFHKSIYDKEIKKTINIPNRQATNSKLSSVIHWRRWRYRGTGQDPADEPCTCELNLCMSGATCPGLPLDLFALSCRKAATPQTLIFFIVVIIIVYVIVLVVIIVVIVIIPNIIVIWIIIIIIM